MLIDRATPRPNGCHKKWECHNDIRLTPRVSALFMFPLELDTTLGSERLMDLEANKKVRKIEGNCLRKEINSYN